MKRRHRVPPFERMIETVVASCLGVFVLLSIFHRMIHVVVSLNCRAVYLSWWPCYMQVAKVGETERPCSSVPVARLLGLRVRGQEAEWRAAWHIHQGYCFGTAVCHRSADRRQHRRKFLDVGHTHIAMGTSWFSQKLM
jgi:hypothetical protein